VSIGLRAEPQPLERAGLPDAVAVSGVSRVYQARNGGGSVPALADVSLRAAAGELVAVVGPSGCGKTTLLELICGLQTPDAGGVRSEPAALMPQHDLLLPWLSAVDNAALALRIARRPRAQARARAKALFAELGLDGFEAARPHELSGGMRQRVAFARTLLSGKPVLCLDEPFGALDAITRTEMQGWLARALAQEPRTVVLVTHDVEEAVLLADRVVVLCARPGRVVAELEVELPRPRARTDAAVTALREQALIALGLGASQDGAPREAPMPAGPRQRAPGSGAGDGAWSR
jgi:ABC-type nitrate/sulfonate/bicarbonate transport system ATPase subunit